MGNKLMNSLEKLDAKLDEQIKKDEMEFVDLVGDLSKEDMIFQDFSYRSIYNFGITAAMYPMILLAANRILPSALSRKG
jgi:hypothetical protein